MFDQTLKSPATGKVNGAHQINTQVDDTTACSIEKEEHIEHLRSTVSEVLLNARRWLVRTETKQPFYASGAPRQGALDSPEDISRLAPFNEAAAAYLTGKWAGLGFALGSDGTGNYWQGIDLDHISEHPALELLESELPGYTERSPSGDGAHAIGYGESIVSLGSNGTGVEAYSSGRYFTVTGDSAGLGDPVCLAEFIQRKVRPIHSRGAGNGSSDDRAQRDERIDDATVKDLRSALNALNADDRDVWVRVGIALRTLGDTGLGLWLDWSQMSAKWKPEDRRQWDTFNPTTTHWRSVFTMAQEAGWVNPSKNTGSSATHEYPEADEPDMDGDARLEVNFPAPFPGFMAEVVEAGLETSYKPQPKLMTLGVLAGMAGSIGGHYRLPDGTRLNLMSLCLAGTGWGKEHVNVVSQAIVGAADGRLLGRPGSGQGLEDQLEDLRAVLCSVDEIGHLFEAINGLTRGAHHIELAGLMLQLFSASRRTYHTRVLAKVKGATESRAIQSPCFNLLGFSTPEKMGEALTIGNLEDGLAGRMLFAVGDPDVPMRRVRQGFSLPDSAANVAKVVGHANMFEVVDGRLAGGADRGMIKISDAADDALESAMLAFDAESRRATAAVYAKALAVRSYEKMSRIAGVLAVFDNPKEPIVDLPHVQWAEQMVRASNMDAVTFVIGHLQGSKTQRDAARIISMLKRIRAGEIRAQRSSWAGLLKSRGVIARSWALKASNLQKKDFDCAVDHLAAVADVILKPPTEPGIDWLRPRRSE